MRCDSVVEGLCGESCFALLLVSYVDAKDEQWLIRREQRRDSSYPWKLCHQRIQIAWRSLAGHNYFLVRWSASMLPTTSPAGSP